MHSCDLVWRRRAKKLYTRPRIPKLNISDKQRTFEWKEAAASTAGFSKRQCSLLRICVKWCLRNCVRTRWLNGRTIPDSTRVTEVSEAPSAEIHLQDQLPALGILLEIRSLGSNCPALRRVSQSEPLPLRLVRP